MPLLAKPIKHISKQYKTDCNLPFISASIVRFTRLTFSMTRLSKESFNAFASARIFLASSVFVTASLKLFCDFSFSTRNFRFNREWDKKHLAVALKSYPLFVIKQWPNRNFIFYILHKNQCTLNGVLNSYNQAYNLYICWHPWTLLIH